MNVQELLASSQFSLVSEEPKISYTLRCKTCGSVKTVARKSLKKVLNSCIPCTSLKVRAKAREAFEKKLLPGFKILGEFINEATECEMRCPEGHEFKALPMVLKKKCSCRVCHPPTNVLKTAEEVSEILHAEGYRLQGPYVNNCTPMQLICPQGHDYTTEWRNWLSGSRCRTCHENSTRLTPDRVREKVDGDRYLILSIDKDRVHLKCKICGHEKGPLSIHDYRKKPNCKKCGDLGKSDIGGDSLDAHLKSINMNLDAEYSGALQPILVSCKFGHSFERSVASVRSWSACPDCEEINNREKALAELRWKLIESVGDKVVISCVSHPTEVRAITYKHRKGITCSQCRRQFTYQAQFSRIQQRLSEFGFSMVGEFKSYHEKFRVRCAQDHEWDTSLENLLYNYSGCPFCYGNTAPHDLRADLAKYGYVYLSGDYVDKFFMIRTNCKSGHENIKPWWAYQNGTGCAQCNSQRGASESERELAGRLHQLGLVVSLNAHHRKNELDCVFGHNRAVEFCGVYYHSDQVRKKPYGHTEKLLQTKSHYRLFTVFEDEWLEHPHRVLEYLTAPDVVIPSGEIDYHPCIDAKTKYDELRLLGHLSPDLPHRLVLWKGHEIGLQWSDPRGFERAVLKPGHHIDSEVFLDARYHGGQTHIGYYDVYGVKDTARVELPADLTLHNAGVVCWPRLDPNALLRVCGFDEKLVGIWGEGDWKRKELAFHRGELGAKLPIVQSIVSNRQQKTTAVYARKLSIVALDSAQARLFFNKNHLMGSAGAGSRTIALADRQGTIHSALAYKQTGERIEISRFANLLNSRVQGGLGKLLKYFEGRCNSIVSFVDLRYASGRSLESLGFQMVSLNPSWQWVDGYYHYNRLKCRANMDDRLLSEKEHSLEWGWAKLVDRGQAKFERQLP